MSTDHKILAGKTSAPKQQTANKTDERATKEVMQRWRRAVKSKERRIFRFDERVELRLNAIQERMFKTRIPLNDWYIRQAYFRAIGEYDFLDDDWHAIQVGDSWGGKDVSAFFKRDIVIPAEMDGHSVMLRFYIGGDSLMSVNGVPFHGMDPFRNEVVLTKQATANEIFTIEVESYVNWHTGESDLNTFHLAELAVVDEEIRTAYWDFRVAFKVLALNDIDGKLQDFLEKHLWDALRRVPLHEPDQSKFKEGLLDATAEIKETVYNSDRFKGEGLLHLVGHSHLDLVFMWPYREYIRKVGRTHATMLRLMEQYSEFRFCQSQAQLYADIKKYYPALYEQIKQRVAEGRWEPVGAFWVEPDCNLISGESFVRQIIYGQRFWQEEFGMTSHVCWQPDVFGLSWSLPQILHRSGITTIMTNKMFVWNDTNPWRHNTFWWEGMDGSRVLGVVPPGHFIGMVDPDHVDNHWRDYSDKATIGESLYCYGWGDGGGGVDPEMLESANRYQDFPGLVPVKYSGAHQALDSIHAKALDTDMPVWRDELYLEAHRGVFTNKAMLKKLNRRSELLYREAEILAALAWANGEDYPQDRLDEGWRTLLTTQFHDSLPGTHINEVYPTLLAEYDQLTTIGEEVRQCAINALFPSNNANHVLLFNSFLHARSDSVTIDAARVGNSTLADAQGKPIPQQRITTLEGSEQIIVQGVTIPPAGYTTIQLTDSVVHAGNGPAVSIDGNTGMLENDLLRATFEGEKLISLWDKQAEREVIAPRQTGNTFALYDDQPGKYDAWDIIAQYVEHEITLDEPAQINIDENGPVRASLRIIKPCLSSTITQRISLETGSRQLVFETMIDWQERQKLLKVGFPLDINTDQATYDIAYGNMQRPTHRNNTYDAARFEVPAHLWMDMSEHDYGVAFLNDCKYGHEANGNLMRLTLLKGSIYPDPYADLETHHFTYTLKPHAGNWREASVHQAALNLNHPVLTMKVHNAPSPTSMISCDAENITLEAVKRSEDGKHLIFRLVERYNQRTQARLILHQAVKAAWSCDLMENTEVELAIDDNTITVSIKPNKIITVRVAL